MNESVGLVRVGKRKIHSTHEFDHLFDNAKGNNVTVKKEALLMDTMEWVKRVIATTLDQSKKIALYLQGKSERETCKNIWNFCFHHIQYKKDKKRKEQIRTPNRAWMDRKTGIDCDCFTVLICSMLENLNIPFVFRLTRYEAANFEHIYPVALTQNGEVIIDCVVHQFDYEVPYTEKNDMEMDIEILNGVPDERYNEFGDKVSFERDVPIDATDLFGDEMELDGIFNKEKRAARKAKRKEKKATRKEKRAAFKKLPLKEKFKRGVNAINKVNPATALLRAGILASMKLNLFKVASHLRFAYWSDNEARKNDVELVKLYMLRGIREKMEKIYYTAGGKTEALRKAILEGKGNRNRMVQLNGLGSIIRPVSDHDDLRSILGEDLYLDEVSDAEGLNGLGAIATGAAITAASGVLGTIAAMIKKIGGIFKKGSKAAQQFKIQDNSDTQEEKQRRFSFKNIANKIRTKIQDRRANKNGAIDNEQIEFSDDEFDDIPEEELPLIPEDEFITDEPFTQETLPSNSNGEEEGTDEFTDPDQKGENKLVKWVKDHKVAVGATVAGLAIGGTALGLYLKNRKKKGKKGKAVNGITKSKKKKKKKTTGTRRKPTRTTRKKRSTPRKRTTGPKVQPML